MSNPYQPLNDLTRSFIDQQLTLTNRLYQQASEKIGQLTELNLQAGRLHAEEAAEAARELIEAGSPQQALEQMVRHAQPNAEKIFSVSQHLMMMMANAQAELNQIIDAHVAQVSRTSLEMLDKLGEQAPEGSAPAIDAIKNAIAGTEAAYLKATQSARAAAEAFDDQFSHLAGHYSPKSPPERPSKPGKNGKR